MAQPDVLLRGLQVSQLALPLDGFCSGPLFAPLRKQRPPTLPKGKEGVVHRAQTRRATPSWADLTSVRAFYREAKRLTQETGELHVVDHIVSKINPLVCGLHVSANLQVLHWRVNTQKANLWWPDMWGAQEPLL